MNAGAYGQMPVDVALQPQATVHVVSHRRPFMPGPQSALYEPMQP